MARLVGVLEGGHPKTLTNEGQCDDGRTSWRIASLAIHLRLNSRFLCKPIDAMDCVPFAFSQSVCVLLDFTLLDGCQQLGSPVWNKAGRVSSDSRVFFSIGYSNGAWSYNLQVLAFPWTECREITFEEMKRINRRHLQVVRIDLVQSLTINPHAATLEEIFKILNFALTFLNEASLHESYHQFPEDSLSLLLTRVCSVPFRALDLKGTREVVKTFLRIQLQSNDALKSIALGNGGFSDFYAEVEELANKNFDAIDVTFSSLVFDKTFFETLFSKPLGEKQRVRRFSAHFSFSDEELKAFRSEEQEEREYEGRIAWRRKDGVRVTVTKDSPFCPGLWWIKFTRS